MKIFKLKQLCKKTVLFAACLFMTVSVFSQEAEAVAQQPAQETAEEKKEPVVVLTVDEAVAYSAEHSFSLKTAQIDLELAKWKKNTAWNTFLPTVQLTGALARANDVSSSIKSANSTIEANKALYGALGSFNPAFAAAAANMNPVSETESMHWTAMGNLSISFSFNVAMIQNMRATMASYESGVITWQTAVKENELNIKKLFYSLLLQQESLALQKASLENARQRMNQAATNYRNGYIPQIKYLQTQVAYENQVPSVEKAEAAMRQSLDTFSLLIGMPVGTKIELKGEINPEYIDVDIEQLIKDGIENNLSVKALRENLKMLKMQASALDLSTYTPSLALSWNGQPMITDAFKNDWGVKDNWKDSGSFSISLVWNLTNMLPWSSSRTSARELKDNVAKLNVQLEMLERNTELEVRTASDTLAQCKKAIEASERNITLAQRSYDMTWQAYRNGTTEYLDLKEAENQLNQAKLSLVSEKFNYMTSLMDLEYKLNTTLTGDK